MVESPDGGRPQDKELRMKASIPLVFLFSCLACGMLHAQEDPFMIGWYLYDDPSIYETVSHPDYVVDHHGDPELYYYEPSSTYDLCEKGETIRAHGLLDLNREKSEIAFCAVEQFILQKAGNEAGNVALESVFTYLTPTDLDTFEEATFTYAMVYLYIPPDDDPTLYTMRVHSVDDGIEVLTNAHITGFMEIFDPHDRIFDLDEDIHQASGVLQTGFNTIILILVDDSRTHKSIDSVEFLIDGQSGGISFLSPNILYGRVFDFNNLTPIRGAEIRLGTEIRYTDGMGYYYFSGLDEGTYAIEADAEHYQTRQHQVDVVDSSAFYQAFYLEREPIEDGDEDEDAAEDPSEDGDGVETDLPVAEDGDGEAGDGDLSDAPDMGSDGDFELYPPIDGDSGGKGEGELSPSSMEDSGCQCRQQEADASAIWLIVFGICGFGYRRFRAFS